MPQQEPSAQDLARIEAEWPLIEAELALLDAELVTLSAGQVPSELARRRVRRAEVRVLAKARAWAARNGVAGTGVAA